MRITLQKMRIQHKICDRQNTPAMPSMALFYIIFIFKTHEIFGRLTVLVLPPSKLFPKLIIPQVSSSSIYCTKSKRYLFCNCILQSDTQFQQGVRRRQEKNSDFYYYSDKKSRTVEQRIKNNILTFANFSRLLCPRTHTDLSPGPQIQIRSYY
jgi:hypothetical protein